MPRRGAIDYSSGFQPFFTIGKATWGVAPGWYKAAPLALSQQKSGAPTRAAVLIFLFALTPAFAKTQQHSVKIKIINAKTNHPVIDEKLNVALKEDQKEGIIEVDTRNATILRILSNMYADCRPRGELYTNYSIEQIHREGITTGNLCSDAKPKAKPGELILFEIPRTFIPNYPAPPASSVPSVPVTPTAPPASKEKQ
jgi:hypothetical protein